MSAPQFLPHPRRALVVAVVVSIVAWLASGAAVLKSAQHEAAVAERQQREATARLLLQLTVTDPATPIALSPANGYRHPWRYQVWTHDGTLLRTNHLRSSEPFTPLVRHRTGHGSATIDDTPHRVFAAWNTDATRQVQVAQRDEPAGLALDLVPMAWIVLFGVCTVAVMVLLGLATTVALRAPLGAPPQAAYSPRFGPPQPQR